MIRKFRNYATATIVTLLLASAAASAPRENSHSSQFDRSSLPLMWENPDRVQNSAKQSGSQKLSSAAGEPEIDAVWTCSTQWLSGVNFGGETFGGSIAKGKDFFGRGSTIADSEYVKVQIIFETDISKQTLCQTFRRDLGYIASGVGTFPGSAWDISDTLNPRRLNLCFVEYSPGGNVNLQWDPTTSNGSREYLFVMNSDYDGSGTTYDTANVNFGAAGLDKLYGWWPVIPVGHTFFESEPCTLTITPYDIAGFTGIPDGDQIILDWRYVGSVTIDHFDIYGDTVSPPATLLAQVSGTTTRYVDNAVTIGETYYYRIEADDAARSIVSSSKELSILAQTPFSNTVLVDFWNGRSRYGDCWAYVDTNGNEYALICARNEGVSIIDLSTSPISEVGFLPAIVPGNDAKDVKTYQNYAIVVSQGESTQIFDISDVTNPVQVSTIAHDNGSGAHNCKVVGDYLYIIGDNNTGGLLIYDISTPASPTFVSSFEPYYYHDIDIYNDTLYAAAIWGEGIDVLDISNKAAPSLITTFNYPGSGAHNVAVLDSGRYVAVGDEIGDGQHTRIFDVQNLGSVTKVADIIVDPSASAHNCYEKNGILYIAHYTEGLQLYNVANPTIPLQIGYYDTYLSNGYGYRGNWNVYPYLPSGKILLSDMQSGLFVIEFSDSCLGQMPGDADGDGGINILDQVFLIDFLTSGGPAPVPLANGDFNGDCIIDLGDINGIELYLLGGAGPVDCTCLEPTVEFVDCCVGSRGDINGDGNDLNILDLTFTVDFIFRGSNDPGDCPEEADFNSDGEGPDILDLTFAVDFIFRGGDPAEPCP
ncbi:MAG: choice-of-anchor B family protein [candidate division Zixibacteria bacterium]|nr:choice-of-anchor B family protein [candidate division Zixibacteria bacterium]